MRHPASTGRLRPALVERALALLGPGAVRDRPLGPLTTYRVGGPAAAFLEVADRDGLLAVHRAWEETRLPLLVVGKGSNLLVSDAGFPGIALTLGTSWAWVSPGPGVVRAGGATGLPVLARQSGAAGLAGLEWAVGVPGSLGGGVRMNAGGHGSDLRRCLLRAGVFDLCSGEEDEVAAEDLRLGYRSSSVRPSQVVLWGDLAAEPGDPATSRARIDEIVRWRREHQPGGANAGSVFTNPEGDAAGRLIEAAGLKGLRLGSAQVSPKHANFIQADAGGSADDVAALIAELRSRVAEQAGVELRPELRMIGFPKSLNL